MTVFITASTGERLVVDDDFEHLGQRSWRNNGDGYFYATIDLRPVAIHRLITNAPRGKEVDHINHNTLDNRRCNLRIVTRQQNQWNGRPHQDSRSGYRGIWRLPNGRWQVSLHTPEGNRGFGTFATPEEAARRFDEVARELYGEFAYQNFPVLVEENETTAAPTAVVG